MGHSKGFHCSISCNLNDPEREKTCAPTNVEHTKEFTATVEWLRKERKFFSFEIIQKHMEWYRMDESFAGCLFIVDVDDENVGLNGTPPSRKCVHSSADYSYLFCASRISPARGCWWNVILSNFVYHPRWFWIQLKFRSESELEVLN
jgi:hypothetical protein